MCTNLEEFHELANRDVTVLVQVDVIEHLASPFSLSFLQESDHSGRSKSTYSRNVKFRMQFGERLGELQELIKFKSAAIVFVEAGKHLLHLFDLLGVVGNVLNSLHRLSIKFVL